MNTTCLHNKHRLIPTIFFIALFITHPVYAKRGISKATRFSMPVETVKAVSFVFQKKIDGIGTFLSNQAVSLKSGIDGHIVGIHFNGGEHVNKGRILIVIDHLLLSSKFKEAKAQLTLNKVNYQRARKLILSKSISESELDEAKARFQIAEAKVEQIQSTLNKAFVRAPFSGEIGLRHINMGQYIKSDQALLSLESTDPIYIDFTTNEANLSDIKAHQSITVRTTSYPKKTFKGHILAIDTKINHNTRSITVRGILPNPKHLLVPGGFAEVTLHSSQKQRVIIVPQEALITTKNRAAVYLVKKGYAVKTPVKVAQRTNNSVMITSGLKPNDEVIVSGQLKLRDHSPVTPRPFSEKNRAQGGSTHGLY